MEMNMKTEKLIVSLIHSISDHSDMSRAWIAADVFKEVGKCMNVTTITQITPMQIAIKVKKLVDGYIDFLWFMTKPGIIYLEEHNHVITQPQYHVLCAAIETTHDNEFRNKGFRHFNEMRDMMEIKGLGQLDFDMILGYLESDEKKWIGNPGGGYGGKMCSLHFVVISGELKKFHMN